MIRNTDTGKRYRIAFTNNINRLEVTAVSINNRGVLNVEGKVERDEILKLFILKPTEADNDTSYTWDDVDQSDMTGTVLDVVEFRASGEGRQVSHQFPDTAVSGAYGVLIVGDDLEENYYSPSIFYTSKRDLENAFDGLNVIVKKPVNDSNARELSNYIDANGRMLYVDTTYFDQLSDQSKIMACKELFKSEGYADMDDFRNTLGKSIVTAWSREGKSPEEILDAYKDTVPALYKEYCGLKTKTLVNAAVKKAGSSEEFETLFNRMTTVEMVNEAPAPAEPSPAAEPTPAETTPEPVPEPTPEPAAPAKPPAITPDFTYTPPKKPVKVRLSRGK